MWSKVEHEEIKVKNEVLRKSTKSSNTGEMLPAFWIWERKVPTKFGVTKKRQKFSCIGQFLLFWKHRGELRKPLMFNSVYDMKKQRLKVKS